MFNVENEHTTEPTKITVPGSMEANFIVAALLLNNWCDNPGESDLPETWEGAKNLAYNMINQTTVNRLNLNSDGINVQWVSSL